MAGPRPLGPLIHSFFADHLITVKGLRPASVRSYRDTIRLLLCFAASDKHTKITRLSAEDLTFDRVLGFLRYLERDRGNHARTRNQRLAALHTLFGYIASREPQMLGTCQQVAAIPAKRAAPAQTRFLERDEVEALFRSLPAKAASPCEIAPCCYFSTTPARGSRRPPTFGPATSTWASTHSPACTARAANGGPARYGATQHSCSPNCSRAHTTLRRRKCPCSAPRPASR
jgi:hypothetical protein